MNFQPELAQFAGAERYQRLLAEAAQVRWLKSLGNERPSFAKQIQIGLRQRATILWAWFAYAPSSNVTTQRHSSL